MASFDSSDEEGGREADLSPLNITWFDLTSEEEKDGEVFGICSLPGCKFMDTWRSLDSDIKCLVDSGVKDIFCLCTKGELNKYRVPRLLTALTEADITVHHTHFPDGETPPIHLLVDTLDEIKVAMLNQRKPVVHCFGGLGRSCLVGACFMMVMDNALTSDESIEKMREKRGPRAVQSVRQYNFINDFRKTLEDYNREDEEATRSLSR